MQDELVWIGAAFALGFGFARVGLPPLVGYLTAGYALGAMGYTNSAKLEHFAELGVLFLLFSVGLKIRLKSLVRKEVVGVGCLHLVIVIGVAAIGFVATGGQLTGSVVLGASLAFSSTVLAVKVLEDTDELESLHGRDVLGILILQDIVAVASLALLSGKQPSPWALGFIAMFALRPFLARMFRWTRPAELRLLLGVGLALTGGELAHRVGISEHLGALLFGVLLAGAEDADELSEQLWGMKETFLVAFFLQIGLAGLPDYEAVIAALQLLAVLPLQGVLFFALFLLLGMRARTAFIASLALMTYSEFALIVAGVAVEKNLLPAEWQTILGLAVAGSLALAAPLSRHSHRLFAWLEVPLVRLERRGTHPDRLPVSLGTAEWLVFGMGRTGSAAYATLEVRDLRVVGLDADPTEVQRHRAAGRRVLYGDAEDSELWETLPIQRLKGILIAVPRYETRLDAIRRARARGFVGTVATTAFRAEEDPTLRNAGADIVLHPLADAGVRLAEQVVRREL